MSNKSGQIRRATPADAQQCLNIYCHYVENTAISFEQALPSNEQMAQRIKTLSRDYPWLIYEQAGEVKGYAYASPFRPRPAYRWTVEVTIYMADDTKGQGRAADLYARLLGCAVKQGFYTAIAVITEPNEQSERFHKKMGFNKIGSFKSIGYKLNRWNDIGMWQKRLQPLNKNPIPPIAFAELD